jgi:hypothetical protein
MLAAPNVKRDIEPELTTAKLGDVDYPTKILTPNDRANITRQTRELDNRIRQAVVELHQATRDKRKPAAPALGPCGLLVGFGDWHFGKEARAAGKVKYDLSIAQRRVSQLTEAIAEEAVFARTHFGADEIVIASAGDIHDGEAVYKHQATTTSTYALDQFIATLDSYGTMLDRLCSLDMPIRLNFARGNHNIRAEGASRAANLDNFLAVALDSGAKRHAWPVEVRYTRDAWIEDTLKDNKILIRHRGPRGSGTASPGNQHKGWLLSHGHDILVYAHNHSTRVEHIHGAWVCRVGSLVGTDDLGEQMGEGDPPAQFCALVGDKFRPLPIVLD